MNFTALFIKRPVMTTLIMVGILGFGSLAYTKLAVSDLPSVDYPTITVNASIPGASPETMASSVATPLEKAFTTIAGIDNMVSTSLLGATSITVQFTLDRNIDGAAQDVQTAIARTISLLPPGMLAPAMQKTNPADQPILYINLHSATMPLPALDEYAETVMAQRMSTVSGVAAVNVGGSGKYAARIQVDPRALASRGIGIDDVANAINSANTNLPTGVLWGAKQALTVQADGQLYNAEQFKDMIITYRNGAPVRVRDIGTVLDDIQNNKTAAWLDGERSISLAIQKQPGTNTVEVADNLKALLPILKAQMPASVDATIFYDRAQGIRDSVRDVKFTLGLTLVLVIAVIFLFLKNVSATTIPSLALPMSLVGTFAVMSILNYSLDNLSLMALTLAVGFVVDDAIVMLENIVRHMEMGKTPMEAALDGAAEIGYDHLDDAVAHGRVHPAPVHGRDYRAPVPRVRGDDRRVDSRVGLRFADAHADARGALPERTPSSEYDEFCFRRVRKGLHRGVQGIRAHAAHRDAPPADDDGILGDHTRRNGVPLPACEERILPVGRSGHPPRKH